METWSPPPLPLPSRSIFLAWTLTAGPIPCRAEGLDPKPWHEELPSRSPPAVLVRRTTVCPSPSCRRAGWQPGPGADLLSAPAKQPGLQSNSPREGREFVLNAGLVSFLLGLSSPATWQPCTERSPCPGCWQTGPGTKQNPFISVQRTISSHDKSLAVDPGTA